MRGRSVRVLQGPLKGKLWLVAAGIHSCWLGVYEGEKAVAFARELQPGDIVLDVGAHAGYYTLLAADKVGPAGQVFAFEPVPRNLFFLQRHVGLNGLTNVTVVPVAVSDHGGLARFGEGPDEDGSTGRFDKHGGLLVSTVCLDDLHTAGWIPRPRLIKVDVEGAELSVLLGAQKLLETTHPILFLAFHGSEVDRACRQLLSFIGYRIEALDADFVRATVDPHIAGPGQAALDARRPIETDEPPESPALPRAQSSPLEGGGGA
jgi:FkbM family methyltransferase